MKEESRGENAYQREVTRGRAAQGGAEVTSCDGDEGVRSECNGDGDEGKLVKAKQRGAFIVVFFCIRRHERWSINEVR